MVIELGGARQVDLSGRVLLVGVIDGIGQARDADAVLGDAEVVAGEGAHVVELLGAVHTDAIVAIHRRTGLPVWAGAEPDTGHADVDSWVGAGVCGLTGRAVGGAHPFGPAVVDAAVEGCLTLVLAAGADAASMLLDAGVPPTRLVLDATAGLDATARLDATAGLGALSGLGCPLAVSVAAGAAVPAVSTGPDAVGGHPVGWAAARAVEVAAIDAGCRVVRTRDVRASRRSADITLALVVERDGPASRRRTGGEPAAPSNRGADAEDATDATGEGLRR